MEILASEIIFLNYQEFSRAFDHSFSQNEPIDQEEKTTKNLSLQNPMPEDIFFTGFKAG